MLSEALVTPSSTVCAVAGSPPSARTWLLILLDRGTGRSARRQQLGVARRVDAHLAQHLANDDLDVLVVDGHTLGPVDLLHLVHQVELDGVAARAPGCPAG